jgi:hypothetical protein
MVVARPSEIPNLDKAISIYQKRIDEMTVEYKRDEEILELKGKNKKLSLVEKLKRNRKMWEIQKMHIKYYQKTETETPKKESVNIEEL